MADERRKGYDHPHYPAGTKRYVQFLELVDDPALIEEYKMWHSAEHIWPEIPKGIKEVGILDMELFLFGNHLCMIVETPADFDWDKQMSILSKLERQEEWEKFVDRWQLCKPGQASSEKWQLMERVFCLPK